MARILYNVVIYMLTPFVCLRLWWLGRRVPGYRQRWLERFGYMPAIPESREVIWVHSVSVGETIAAVPLIRRLQEIYPAHLVAVTTVTPTGSDRVQDLLGESVYHCYAPYDLPDAVTRTLDRLHPRCLIIMETELWPNLIHHAHLRDIPLLLANARLSAKSARGYGRVGFLTRPTLSKLSLVAAQCPEDGERFLHLGLSEKKLVVTGNIKFDLSFKPEHRQLADQLRREWRGESDRPVWLAASTHQGEEEMVLTAFKQIRRTHPSTLLVLVPRHPDRFDTVAALCSKCGYSVVRRSTKQVPDCRTDVLLGDTMGELQLLYGACDLAFVGGSLVPLGGHNLVEPAAWKKPILSGPELFNFSEIAGVLVAADGLVVCDSPEEIAGAVIALLNDDQLRSAKGQAAHAVVQANRGAMDSLLTIISQLMV